AAVDALEHRHLRTPDNVEVDGIDRERRVIPGALAQVLFAIDAFPVLTAVIRAVKFTLVGFDERVDATTFRRSDGNAYLAPDPLRKSLAPVLFGGLLVGEVFPGVAAVARHVQAAARPATAHLPPPPP